MGKRIRRWTRHLCGDDNSLRSSELKDKKMFSEDWEKWKGISYDLVETGISKCNGFREELVGRKRLLGASE